jgi:hypothetical protein
MINSNIFNFKFFLGGKIKVESLERGATEYGGATIFEDGIYSNIKTNDFIKVKDINTISLFIPSTIEINNKADNSLYVETVINLLSEKYNINDITFYKTSGSWFNEEGQQIIIEDITIINLRLKEINISDINIFIEMANFIKEEMKQEAVSININDCLAIV